MDHSFRIQLEIATVFHTVLQLPRFSNVTGYCLASGVLDWYQFKKPVTVIIAREFIRSKSAVHLQSEFHWTMEIHLHIDQEQIDN